KVVLAELGGQYDHIIVDTPPTLSVTDAVVLSTRADAVVLVIRSGQTTKPALRRSRDILAQVNARVAGVLLNAVDLDSPDYYYYYEYQGKYGQRYYDENMTGDDSVKAASGGAYESLNVPKHMEYEVRHSAGKLWIAIACFGLTAAYFSLVTARYLAEY